MDSELMDELKRSLDSPPSDSHSSPDETPRLWPAQAVRPLVLKLLNRPQTIPLFILLAGLVLGLVIAADYGRSVDEYVHHVYAEQTLEVYFGERQPEDTISNLRYYGPVYSVFTEIVTRAVARVMPDGDLADGRHFVYFTSFLIGSLAVFYLTKRYVSTMAALAVVLLFLTQPLLFGHAFINPKDVPFMAFFTLTMALGFHAADGLLAGDPTKVRMAGLHRSTQSFSLAAYRRYRNFAWFGKRGLLLALLALAIFLVTLDAFAFNWSLAGFQFLLEAAYDGHAWEPLQRLFSVFAEDAWKTPLEIYIGKANRTFLWARYIWVVVAWSGAIALFDRKVLYGAVARCLSQNGRWFFLIFAAVVLGLATAIRIGGIFAGLLVSALFVGRLRAKAIPVLALYWIVGATLTYVSWPYLWGSPVHRLLETARVVTSFDHVSQELFFGGLEDSFNLPWSFVPTLLGIQFTEPVVILSMAGLVVAITRGLREDSRRLELWLLLSWLFIPVAAQVLLRSTLYNNFRQLLFITPSLFVFAGVALEVINSRLRAAWIRVLLASAVLVPGVFALWKLHPYQYVYYNSFVGGVPGAAGQFEMDYWCTSYKEAIQYVNRVAPNGAEVAVQWSPSLASPYAREDLDIYLVKTEHDVRMNRPEYLLVCSIGNHHERFFTDLETLYKVMREGAVLSVVKAGPGFDS